MKTATLSMVGEVLLVRLLTAGANPPPPSRLRDFLANLLQQGLTTERWEELRQELVNAGLVTAKPFRLTEAGKAQALEFLGIEKLPPGANWTTVRSHYLVPKALGIDTSAPKAREQVVKADDLRAHLLKTHYDLPDGTEASLAKVLEALACKQVCEKLGLECVPNLKSLRLPVLRRLLGTDESLDAEQLWSQLPRKAVGAKKVDPDGLREAILQRWLAGKEPTVAPSPNGATAEAADFDLSAFAATVQAAARHCPSGWFGDNKVFISHVWRHLQGEPGFPQLDLPSFKARLVEANRAGLLLLSRADLVEAMSPVDVRESETSFLTATFHFVLTERKQP